MSPFFSGDQPGLDARFPHGLGNGRARCTLQVTSPDDPSPEADSMPALYVTEAEVRELLDMETSIGVMEEVFEQLAAGKATNVPRTRAKSPGICLHTMSAAAEYLGLVGWKA